MTERSMIRIDGLTGEARVIEVVLDTLGSEPMAVLYRTSFPGM